MSVKKALQAGDIVNLPVAVYEEIHALMSEASVGEEASVLVSWLGLPSGAWIAWNLAVSVDGEMVPAIRIAWDGTNKTNASACILADGRAQVVQYPTDRTVRAADALVRALVRMSSS